MRNKKLIAILITQFIILFNLFHTFLYANLPKNIVSNKNLMDKSIDLNNLSWENNGTAVCNETNEQIFPSICSDGSGGAIIIWRDKRGGLDYDIYAQRINSTGDINWTLEGIPICTAPGDQIYASICSDDVGGFIIAWQDERNGAEDIYAQRINSTGHIQWENNGTAICTCDSYQWYPHVVSDGVGGAIIAWQDRRNFGSTASDIYAQRVNSSGHPLWTANGTGICTASAYQNYFTMCSDGLGGAIFAWEDWRGDPTDAYAQRINSSGDLQWDVNGVVICNAASYQSTPRICSDGLNGVYLVWDDDRGKYHDIYTQRINSSGDIQWINNGIIICNAHYEQISPTIISDGIGGAIIIWEDWRKGDDIYAQKVDSSGVQFWGFNGRGICTAPGDQYNYGLCSDGAGGAIITWQDYRYGGYEYSDIFTQWINSSGDPQWPKNGIIVCNENGKQLYPKICSNGSGGAIITWEDRRNNTNYDIYAQSTLNISKEAPPPAPEEPFTIPPYLYYFGQGFVFNPYMAVYLVMIGIIAILIILYFIFKRRFAKEQFFQ